MNELSKLLHYVKQKETNAVQSIRRVPVEVGGELMFLVCMDRELVIFDFQRKTILNSLVFSYSNMRQKIFEKEEQRRLQREKVSQEREQEQEQLDKVEVPRLDSNSPRKNSHTANRLRGSNLRSSVRGSSISSEKSNDRMLFRRRTESGEGKKRRTGQVRVRNDDVGRLFQMFEQASVQNSITIANAYS